MLDGLNVLAAHIPSWPDEVLKTANLHWALSHDVSGRSVWTFYGSRPGESSGRAKSVLQNLEGLLCPPAFSEGGIISKDKENQQQQLQPFFLHYVRPMSSQGD